MNSDYLQSDSEHKHPEAPHLVTQLRPRVMTTTSANLLKPVVPLAPFITMLRQLPTQKMGMSAFDPLASFAPWIAPWKELGRLAGAARIDHLDTLKLLQPTATFAGWVKAASAVSGSVTDGAAVDQLDFLRPLLPKATFASLVRAASAPSSSLKRRAEEITQLLADTLVDQGASSPLPPSEDPVQAGAGLSLGDEAIAHVTRPSVQGSDANWWESLSHDTKMTILFSLVMALVLLVPQIPSIINSYREMRDGSDAITHEQGRQLIAATMATKETLAELLALQKKSKERDASFQREVVALQRESRPWLDPLLVQPCEVLVETTVRESVRVGTSMQRIDRLQAGDLVVCMGHHGKWLEVAYLDKNGDLAYGRVRKKHLTWEDAQ